jgi:hypothetical protein
MMNGQISAAVVVMGGMVLLAGSTTDRVGAQISGQDERGECAGQWAAS